jgi:hypothetical protein
MNPNLTMIPTTSESRSDTASAAMFPSSRLLPDKSTGFGDLLKNSEVRNASPKKPASDKTKGIEKSSGENGKPEPPGPIGAAEKGSGETLPVTMTNAPVAPPDDLGAGPETGRDVDPLPVPVVPVSAGTPSGTAPSPDAVIPADTLSKTAPLRTDSLAEPPVRNFTLPASQTNGPVDLSGKNQTTPGNAVSEMGEEKKGGAAEKEDGSGSTGSETGDGKAPSFTAVPTHVQRADSENFAPQIENHQPEPSATGRPFRLPEEGSTGDQEVVRQLTVALSLQRTGALQSIRLNLSPESLGSIQIDLSVQNQQVKAELVASTPQVKELLEKHQDLLRNAMADNGLRVDQFTVRLAESSSARAENSSDPGSRSGPGDPQLPDPHPFREARHASAVSPSNREPGGSRNPVGITGDAISIYV